MPTSWMSPATPRGCLCGSPFRWRVCKLLRALSDAMAQVSLLTEGADGEGRCLEAVLELNPES